ncbi:uncharacterized protein BO66DRAFT_437099 [Aspergillus aculeatinus CBS 121060]|uniref:Uncharacterized protein n=1 Tax=Aspergillus aculeatinus CBS 121060 TaxID=1448322 RepID=A0ACD1HDC5_9EURO|nr:hypothetical protein BO66DRAFT_437099 [Aspergillus aculeatinus CBS 121060]RAH71475.1 hypothetical protein BO66DRAFT_437099 [Aspergillus aculeatinus CBS 121060]
MLDAVIWLLLVLLLMALTFAILGMLVGLLCALVTTATMVQTPDSERALRLDYLQKKHALVAEARALVRRHARLTAQIDEARDLKDSIPHSTKDHSMQRNQLM